MTREHDFVVDLARANQTCPEIKRLSDSAFGEKALSKSQIYRIIKNVKDGVDPSDKRTLSGRKRKRTEDIIEAVKDLVEADRRISIGEIRAHFDLGYSTIQRILRDDLGLTLKSARWVPKLLSEEQKTERVRCAQAFKKLLFPFGKSGLNKIITMDETLVSFYTPETKRQSMQWLPKGSPAPIKAKVSASRTKQMVLSFFDNDGVIYQNYVPRGQTVNAEYFITIVSNFLKQLRIKRPEKCKDNDWFLHMDNAPCHKAKATMEFMLKRGIKLIEHPPYSPDLAPADFFFFPKLKAELAGTRITDSSVRTVWERVTNSLTKEDFVAAFEKWEDRWDKCVKVNGDYVEK